MLNPLYTQYVQVCNGAVGRLLTWINREVTNYHWLLQLNVNASNVQSVKCNAVQAAVFLLPFLFSHFFVGGILYLCWVSNENCNLSYVIVHIPKMIIYKKRYETNINCDKSTFYLKIKKTRHKLKNMNICQLNTFAVMHGS